MLKRVKATDRKSPACPQDGNADGRQSSRISTGRDLLPNEDGRSRWARLLKATYRALIAHCGGDDAVTDPQRIACRRIGALEAELVHIEDRLARLRRSRKEPPQSLLQSYASLTAQQLRLSREIGWERYAKPLNDEPQDLHSYLARRSASHRSVILEHEEAD